MPACNKLATITFIAMAMLAPLGLRAQAAQCGNGPGGFEAWKSEFAREASAKGVGATATSALAALHSRKRFDHRWRRVAPLPV